MPLSRKLVGARPGELVAALPLALTGFAFYGATTLGEDLAESIFVGRLGAEELPTLFIAKAVVDLFAALLYALLPQTSAARTWRSVAMLYAASMLAARWWLSTGQVAAIYGAFLSHELASTLLTIHWGVLALQAFDASQARRLFPLLFAVAQLGAAVGGGLLSWVAPRFGAVRSLYLAGALAALSAALSWLVRDAPEPRPQGPAPRPWSGWRSSTDSPLVRAIAITTALMVVVRYGLQFLSLDAIARAFDNDETRIASFLGRYSAWASGLGVVLGAVVGPRVIARYGAGTANVAYACATAVAYLLVLPVGGTYVSPIGGAVFARFAHIQLKHALRTPLSALFYGAEPPHRRPLARAFVFGLVIPASTVTVGIVFSGVQGASTTFDLLAYGGLLAALAFVFASWWQNAAWRRRLRELLTWELERAKEPSPTDTSAYREMLGGHVNDEALSDELAKAWATDDQRCRALAEEVLSEQTHRPTAAELNRRLRAAAVVTSRGP